jgi:hypothetical protein
MCFKPYRYVNIKVYSFCLKLIIVMERNTNYPLLYEYIMFCVVYQFLNTWYSDNVSQKNLNVI